uniref:Seipin n=1 Tax=Timema bartmani TaxID=61472 RepID=A0A7R9EQ71_9NEOP|nr:unnamed protein product [Timema bartmani]
MFGFQFLSKSLNIYRRTTASGVQNIKDVLCSGGLVALVASLIIWVAIFLYVAFYYTYMPSTSHIRPVHLQFKSCEELQGPCSFPSAHVQLTKRQQLLMVGQSYKMFLNLEMPESPANKMLGMFMVCVELQGKDEILVDSSCRSAMLHYRSSLLHALSTLTFSPMLLFGHAEEKQNVILELFSDFEEDQNHPVTDIYVEIQSRHVELYSASLGIHAHFTGLRYLMFHWPLLSAAVGITSNLFFILLITGLSWYQLYQPESEEAASKFQYAALDRKDEFKFNGELDDSSFEDASFIEDSGKLNESDQSIQTLETESREFITELARS